MVRRRVPGAEGRRPAAVVDLARPQRAPAHPRVDDHPAPRELDLRGKAARGGAGPAVAPSAEGVVARPEDLAAKRGASVARAGAADDRLVIAIDGPAAAGKTTVASAVARRLDALFFDTGVIYRALTLAALERGVNPENGLRLAGLARHLDIQVLPASSADGRLYDVWMEGRDVTWEIRSAEVDRAVSAVSAHRDVRRILLGVQRRIGQSGRVVMTGRDVGTAVMPNADLKIWLDASPGERVRRRQVELAQRGISRSLEEIRAELSARDSFDASRVASPMKPAPDSVVIDTDGRSIDEVVSAIVELVGARMSSCDGRVNR